MYVIMYDKIESCLKCSLLLHILDLAVCTFSKIVVMTLSTFIYGRRILIIGTQYTYFDKSFQFRIVSHFLAIDKISKYSRNFYQQSRFVFKIRSN